MRRGLPAQRKNKLDDYRRFEHEIIALYLQIEATVRRVTDRKIHGAGDTDRVKADKELFHDNYRTILSATSNLEMIGSDEISELTGQARKLTAELDSDDPNTDLFAAEFDLRSNSGIARSDS